MSDTTAAQAPTATPATGAVPSVAYQKIQAAAFVLGRPLLVAEVVGLIQSDPVTRDELKLINDELEDGMEITDREIAIRLKMPLGFVRSLLLAIRGDTADQRPARTN